MTCLPIAAESWSGSQLQCFEWTAERPIHIYGIYEIAL